MVFGMWEIKGLGPKREINVIALDFELQLILEVWGVREVRRKLLQLLDQGIVQRAGPVRIICRRFFQLLLQGPSAARELLLGCEELWIQASILQLLERHSELILHVHRPIPDTVFPVEERVDRRSREVCAFHVHDLSVHEHSDVSGLGDRNSIRIISETLQ